MFCLKGCRPGEIRGFFNLSDQIDLTEFCSKRILTKTFLSGTETRIQYSRLKPYTSNKSLPVSGMYKRSSLQLHTCSGTLRHNYKEYHEFCNSYKKQPSPCKHPYWINMKNRDCNFLLHLLWLCL